MRTRYSKVNVCAYGVCLYVRLCAYGVCLYVRMVYVYLMRALATAVGYADACAHRMRCRTRTRSRRVRVLGRSFMRARSRASASELVCCVCAVFDRSFCLSACWVVVDTIAVSMAVTIAVAVSGGSRTCAAHAQALWLPHAHGLRMRARCWRAGSSLADILCARKQSILCAHAAANVQASMLASMCASVLPCLRR